ncbi:FAD-dependent oxidoreductase, partial [Micrococcus luteus]
GLGHRGIGGAATAVEVPLRPVHGDVLRLRVRPEQLLPGESHLITRTVRGLVHGRQVYLVPRADGTLVVGASAREDGLAGTSAGAVLDLLADAAAILPAVRECELVEITTAARPGTPDDAPRVLAVPEAPGAVVATGFHRHGILLAPWAAGRILELLHARLKEIA